MQISIAAFAFGVIVGGFSYGIYFRLPYILTAISMLISLATSFFLYEEKNYQHHHKTLKESLKENLQGFKQLAKINMRAYLLPIILIMFIAYLYDYGFPKPAIAVNFGFYEKEQALIYALMALLNITIIGLLPRIRRFIKDKLGLNLVTFLLGIGFMLASLKLGYLGLLVLIMIELSWNVADPWISIIVNKNIESKYRATTLSTLQFISKLPYILINFILGKAIDNGAANLFHLILGVMIIVLISGSILVNKRNKNNLSLVES
ncbi:MFS transporter [Candidatus Beckwithbacteria bacterium]|nr:MFS transporter [Candidatus Beckwithbacteria bacterium]